VLEPTEDLWWASKDLFNPAAVVHEGRVHLLVRGEDRTTDVAGTSRIGLAISDDGRRFTVETEPVLGPGEDDQRDREWPGGCEDPRVVEHPDGGFVCLYTAFDGAVARLSVATSPDLRTWTKHGSAFAGTRHAERWSKSGAVVTAVVDDRLQATRLGDRFWMYWGEGIGFAATSEDLVHWTPVELDTMADRSLGRAGGDGGWTVHRHAVAPTLRPVVVPRPHRYDSLLVEPGPPAVLTAHGIVLVTNGANHPRHGDPTLAPFAYAPGQVLLDPEEPGSVLARATGPFLRPEASEASGQVADVCFAQGLVRFGGEWLLYLGLADSRIGVAVAPA
jgi:predicted GH43/DUF377 family glycosyl hydrolase